MIYPVEHANPGFYAIVSRNNNAQPHGGLFTEIISGRE
jgi:hypothetical protein